MISRTLILSSHIYIFVPQVFESPTLLHCWLFLLGDKRIMIYRYTYLYGLFYLFKYRMISLCNLWEFQKKWCWKSMSDYFCLWFYSSPFFFSFCDITAFGEFSWFDSFVPPLLHFHILYDTHLTRLVQKRVSQFPITWGPKL